MLQRKVQFIILYALLAGFGLLGIAILLFGPREERISERENRNLAAFPQLSLSNLADGSFMTDFEKYLEDAMFTRDGIISFTDSAIGRLSIVSAEELEQAAQESLEQDIEDRANETTASFEEETAGMQEMAEPIASEPAAASGEAGQTARLDAAGIPECRFYFTRKNGKEDVVYTFSSENMRAAVKLFDTLRGMLAEDGHVYFGQVPFPAIGSRFSDKSYGATGWYCDVDEVLAAYTADGVSTISVTSILQPHLMTGEKMYFRTDHHWTPLAASYVAEAMEKEEGYPFLGYAEYQFNTYDDFRGSAKINYPNITPESIDVLVPLLPTKSYIVNGDGTQKESVYMKTGVHSYQAYLGGTFGPWRRFVTGVDANRRCLVISDSYGNCLIPFLTPYYDEIHSMNLSSDYITPANAGYSLKAYIDTYGIDDIIVIPSTSSSINAGQLKSTIWTYINLK